MANITKLQEEIVSEFEKKFTYLYPNDSTIFQGQMDFLHTALQKVVEAVAEGQTGGVQPYYPDIGV